MCCLATLQVLIFYLQNIPVLNCVPLGGGSNQEWLVQYLISVGVCVQKTQR